MCEPKKYRCIHCLTPSASLYRQYSASVIKLSDCERCKENVDSYCEKEWLLVLLDIVLLRRDAYRHVLFNRLDLAWRDRVQIAVGAGILQALPNASAFLTSLGGLFVLYVPLVAALPAVSKDLLYLAVMLPCCFHIVTLLVYIWEQTDTVSLLGAGLTLIYQGMAVLSIADSNKKAVVALIAGVILRGIFLGQFADSCLVSIQAYHKICLT
jgi:hypothetical protein